VKIAGVDIAKGCYMTNEPLPGDLPYAEAKEFLAAYKAKFGEIPSSPWPIYAADALNIIAYAVDKTKSADSKVLASYLRDSVNGVPGITGPIGFTEQGDREGFPSISTPWTTRGRSSCPSETGRGLKSSWASFSSS
jgi:branched-chain amino acid transport system substrate-binding protein